MVTNFCRGRLKSAARYYLSIITYFSFGRVVMI